MLDDASQKKSSQELIAVACTLAACAVIVVLCVCRKGRCKGPQGEIAPVDKDRASPVSKAQVREVNRVNFHRVIVQDTRDSSSRYFQTNEGLQTALLALEARTILSGTLPTESDTLCKQVSRHSPKIHRLPYVP